METVSRHKGLIISLYHVIFKNPCLDESKGRVIRINYARADFRFALNQWETALLCNDVSHWLGASLESALHAIENSL